MEGWSLKIEKRPVLVTKKKKKCNTYKKKYFDFSLAKTIILHSGESEYDLI